MLLYETVGKTYLAVHIGRYPAVLHNVPEKTSVFTTTDGFICDGRPTAKWVIEKYTRDDS